MHALRALAALAFAAALVLALGSPAFADGGPWGDVDCAQNPTAPECQIVVVDPGGGGNDGGEGGGSSGPLVCRLGGEIVECHSEGWGWLGSGGCYYGKDSGGYLPPNQYIKTCYDPASGNFVDGGVVELFDPPAALAAMARRAVSNLKVPQPQIASNPRLGAPQVVHVPVWWWVQPGLWGTHTASASLPGITITAKATATKINWNAGDGSSTSCAGPGTPWSSGVPPTASSPTCGHTYTKTSRTTQGGKFHLTATVTWSISWAGGGFSGTEPSMTTTAASQVEVTELRAVVTS